MQTQHTQSDSATGLHIVHPLVEIFIEYLDSIYWEGFARQLAADDPQRYLYEWSEFVKYYGD